LADVAVTGDIAGAYYLFDANMATPTTAVAVSASLGTGAQTIPFPPTLFSCAGNSSIIPFMTCPFAGDVRYIVQNVLSLDVGTGQSA